MVTLPNIDGGATDQPAPLEYPKRHLETIDTELAKSGMISAAAKAAEELAAIFQL